jgi:hypothetical protein
MTKFPLPSETSHLAVSKGSKGSRCTCTDIFAKWRYSDGGDRRQEALQAIWTLESGVLASLMSLLPDLSTLYACFVHTWRLVVRSRPQKYSKYRLLNSYCDWAGGVSGERLDSRDLLCKFTVLRSSRRTQRPGP